MGNVLWGLGGIAAVIGLGLLMSTNRKAINWRTVAVGILIQVVFGYIVLKSETGREAVEAATKAVDKLISYANEGVNFLFGGIFQAKGVGFIFALSVLTTIIFFSSLISVLYHFGIMQQLVRFIGGFLSKVLGTSKVESLSIAADIFLGPTEAPLVIKPYISKITSSELFAVMVGGLASVAGSVLVGYSLLGVPMEYLLAASFMAAPAALVMAKLIVPETQEAEARKDIKLPKSDAVNVFDAAARGASEGVQLAINVGAMLLSFIALVALVNGILGGIGNVFGIEGLKLETILGYVFAPIAFVIGVPWSEAVQAGSLIGQKFVLNEFVAFMNFGPMVEQMSDKAAAVISFALCGFANLSVIAIMLGGIGGMAPNRRDEIARFGLKAVIAATLANFLSAAIAGMMI
jgi:concentrative nucleoside transporter, CNT family